MKWVLTGVFLLGILLNSQLCQAMTPEQYINSIAPYAKLVKKQGLFPSVAIAQSCRETGFGKYLNVKDMLGKPIKNYNNVLGKKWRSGQYYEKVTSEGHGNGKHMIIGKFQAYKSIRDCFADYANNINTNSAYKYKDISNIYTFIYSIAPRYATDNPYDYANGVIRIIEKYNLTRFD